jgi:hypothetical protein
MDSTRKEDRRQKRRVEGTTPKERRLVKRVEGRIRDGEKVDPADNEAFSKLVRSERNKELDRMDYSARFAIVKRALAEINEAQPEYLSDKYFDQENLGWDMYHILEPYMTATNDIDKAFVVMRQVEGEKQQELPGTTSG